MKQWTLASILISLEMLTCCANKQRMEPRPEFDQKVGVKENDLIGEFGDPEDYFVREARYFAGELRMHVRKKVPNDKVLVKELYYRETEGERIFWLTKHAGTIWLVVADVYIPPGIAF